MVSIERPGFRFSEFSKAKNLSVQSTIISPLFKHIKNGQQIYNISHSLDEPLSVKLVADNPTTFKGIVLLAASIDPSEELAEKWCKFLFYSTFQYLVPGAFRPSNNEI